MHLLRNTGRSVPTWLLVATVIVGVLPVAPAAAQSGNGLYEPFPEAAVKKRAQRYVDGLRGRTAEPERRYSDAELAAGTFVRAGPAGPALKPAGAAGEARGAGAQSASVRAGGGGTVNVALPLQLFLLVLALALPTAAILKRAPTDAA